MRYILLSVALFIGMPRARAMVCRAQLLSTFCGSGRVEVEFDENKLTYKFHQGDIGCWMADYDFKGTLKHLGKNHPYFLDSNYELFNERGSGLKIGHIIYDPVRKVANLEMEEAAHTQYNLTCD